MDSFPQYDFGGGDEDEGDDDANIMMVDLYAVGGSEND